MIADHIDYDWLVATNELASNYENGISDIDQFTNDQLQYLVYWNWGYSGHTCQLTVDAEAELNARGQHVNSHIAEAIEDIAQQYY